MVLKNTLDGDPFLVELTAFFNNILEFCDESLGCV
jgi:hypothetical protein